MEKKKAISSDSTSVYQIPSKPRKNGRTKTNIHGRQNDLKRERNAEIIPLFNAVKKEEENIFIPENMKEKA